MRARIWCLCVCLFLAGIVCDRVMIGVGSGAWAQAEPPAATCENGDVNGDGDINITDPVSLLQYLFARGPAPVDCCGTDESSDTTIVYMVRHAERQSGEDALNAEGRERARQLAMVFDEADIDVLIATERIRTQETLQPLLEAKENLSDMQIVAAFDGGVESVAAIQALPAGTRAVLASHSTEVDDVLNGLGASDRSFTATTHDDLWVITLRSGDDAQVVSAKFHVVADCP